MIFGLHSAAQYVIMYTVERGTGKPPRKEEEETMKIYETRYQARKAARYGQVVAKVDAGDGKTGYVVMDCADYRIWRSQK